MRSIRKYWDIHKIDGFTIEILPKQKYYVQEVIISFSIIFSFKFLSNFESL